jgi:hypothetical protein
MKTLTTLVDALNFGLECEARSRFGDAEALYRRLLDKGVGGSIDGLPAVVAVYKGLIRSAAMGGRMAAAIEAFEKLMPLVQPARGEVFDRMYLRGLQLTQSHPLPLGRMYRFEELLRRLSSVRHLGGDSVECGCFRGHSSYLIASQMRLHEPAFDGSGFHVFDSFAGLSPPSAQDRVGQHDESADSMRLRTMTRAGHFAASLNEVKAALAEFPAIEFHPGWIPQSFSGKPERKYRFVHVDVDLYEPTRACFEYFWPRLAPGGAMLCDDYVWPGARAAVEEFSAAVEAPAEITPYQQAVFRKPG